MTDVTPTMPADHRELISDLSGIVCDYPYGDPEDSLSLLAGDALQVMERVDTPEGRRERAGYTVLLHATCWYVAARLYSRSVYTSYMKALEGFRATLDPSSCTCPNGSHPQDGDPEYGVGVGVSLLTEAGRAEFAEDYGVEDDKLAAYECEGFLADLADQAAAHIREAYEANFGDIDVSRLDARFVRDGGEIDVVAMQEAIRRSYDHNHGPVGLWSARRWLSGQVRDEDRLGLFLTLWMCINQAYSGLPPAYARDMAAAVDTVDLDVSCDHTRHPWSTAEKSVKPRYRAVTHLYAPEDHPDTPVPADLASRDLWECPVQYAELARSAKKKLEGWREMRGGDEEDWEA
ncbi:hypothetical protein ACWDU9_25895 [Streptomyces cellulosae]